MLARLASHRMADAGESRALRRRMGLNGFATGGSGSARGKAVYTGRPIHTVRRPWGSSP